MSGLRGATHVICVAAIGIAAVGPEQNPLAKLLDTCPKVWSWFNRHIQTPSDGPFGCARLNPHATSLPPRIKTNSFLIKDLIAGRQPMEQLLFQCECCLVQEPGNKRYVNLSATATKLLDTCPKVWPAGNRLDRRVGEGG
jgi:hypothetical protein